MGKMYIETLEVAGIYPAITSMRNPFDSWDKGDSENEPLLYIHPHIGEKDMILAKKLIRGGSEHRKYLRQIQVWANVNMPRYWWSETDTYKFGTKNSQSTMHTLAKKPFDMEDFYLGNDPIVMTSNFMELQTIPMLNSLRDLYLIDKDYRWVKEMKRILPESFLQMRTWNTNYEELRNMYHQRVENPHRLGEEWVEMFGKWIESLPYSQELIIDKK